MVTKIEFADHQFRFQFDALDQYDQSHVCACSSTALKNQSKFLPGLFVGLSFALIFNGIGSRRSRSPISNFLGVMHNSTFFLLLHIFPDLHSWKFALYYANTTSEHVPKKSGQSRQFWGLARSLFISLPAQLAFIAFFLPIYLPFTIVFLPLLFPLLFARRVGFFLQHFFHPRGLEKRRLRHRAWRLFLLSFSILRLTRVWFFAWARHFDLFAKKRGQHNSATITTE